MPRLYLASNNAHKAIELTALLATLSPPWEVHLARDLAPGITWDEIGDSFLANARIKAEALRAHTSACVLADDSGLVVDVLGGEPGVHSSRYAGIDGDDRANNAKLAGAIKSYQEQDLTARFVCTLYFIDESGQGHEFTGVLEGHLTHVARGSHGFGYDPLFVPKLSDPAWQGRTLAEIPGPVKNQISHRALAFAALERWLAKR